eukprot:7085933-Prymnesium_polylepis.1
MKTKPGRGGDAHEEECGATGKRRPLKRDRRASMGEGDGTAFIKSWPPNRSPRNGLSEPCPMYSSIKCS